MNEKIRIRIISENHITEVMERPGISLEDLAAKYYDRSEGYFPVFASVNDVGEISCIVSAALPWFTLWICVPVSPGLSTREVSIFCI